MFDTKTIPSFIEDKTNVEMQICIQDCLDCHSLCLETITYCLQQGGWHANLPHIRLLLDCAEICQTSANFMLRGSAFREYTCDICAEICAECAEECGQFSGDEQMQACADMCRRCALSCQEMAEQSI
jgi:hypothetical protein